MHEPVKGRLEDYLGGSGPFPDVEAHLAACESCRRELAAMRAQARMLKTLRPPRPVEVPGNFYAAVMNRIESQTRPSVWELFGESLFARRLAVASAALVVLIGTFLISSATNPQDSVIAATSPEEILAGPSQELPPLTEVQPDQRGVVLVNLASYSQDFQ